MKMTRYATLIRIKNTIIVHFGSVNCVHRYPDMSILCVYAVMFNSVRLLRSVPFDSVPFDVKRSGQCTMFTVLNRHIKCGYREYIR